MKILYAGSAVANAEIVEKLKKLIHASGGELVIANDSDGSSAALKTESGKIFDMVIVDWDLPAEGARRLIRHIRRMIPGQKIAVIYPQEAEGQKIGSHIANDLLHYNFDRNDIMPESKILEYLEQAVNRASWAPTRSERTVV